MAGRPRTPTAELENRGAFDAHPERRRARSKEPRPNGPLGRPPSYFDAFHRKVWKETVSQAPRGVLTDADHALMELTVRLRCKMRTVPGRMTAAMNWLSEAMVAAGYPRTEAEDFKKAIRTTVGCSSQDLSLLHTCLGRMGMTPADRSKVQVEPEDDGPDPFDAITAAFTTQKRVQ